MAISPYQLPSPQAISPYPIEGELANKLEPQYALGLLNLYRAERQNAQGDYQDEVQAQHKYAYDQLARQMAAEKLKGFTDIAKLPGGVDFARSSGTGLDLGADPESLAQFAGATNLAQASENFQKAGAGWGSLAHAGAQVPFGLVPGLERYAGTPIGETDLVKAARIRAAGGGGGGGGGPDVDTVSSTIAGNAEGDTHTVSTRKVPASRTGDVIERHEVLSEAQRNARRAAAGLPGVSAPPGTTSAAPAPSSAKPTAAKPTGDTVIDTNSPNGKAAQNIAKQQLQATVDHAVKNKDPKAAATAKDIQDNMQGGRFIVVQKPDGAVVIKGKTGEYQLGR